MAGARAMQFAVRQHQHADDVFGENVKFDPAIRGRSENDAIAFVRRQRERGGCFDSVIERMMSCR